MESHGTTNLVGATPTLRPSPVQDGLILLPLAGITLLPPWWMYVLWAGKRCENRSLNVAARIGRWRGFVAFSASKECDKDEAIMIARSVREEPWYKWRGPKPFTAQQMFDRGGHIVGVTELLDVRRRNQPTKEDHWVEPDQSGLMLGRVWEVDPVPCSGGRGMFAFGACAACGHIGAIDGKGAPLACRKCKASTPRERLGRPKLRVVAEFGVDGERVGAAPGAPAAT